MPKESGLRTKEESEQFLMGEIRQVLADMLRWYDVEENDIKPRYSDFRSKFVSLVSRHLIYKRMKLREALDVKYAERYEELMKLKPEQRDKMVENIIKIELRGILKATFPQFQAFIQNREMFDSVVNELCAEYTTSLIPPQTRVRRIVESKK